MTTTKKHYSSLGHQFNGIFHELFNSFEEAQDFAKSIGSEVHLYWRRYGERCWNDEGIHYRPIEMKTDDPDVMWYERAEGARAILQSEGGFEEWFDGCVSAPLKAATDARDLTEIRMLGNFAEEVRSAIEDLDSTEAVAANSATYDIIELRPTRGEYDNRIWTLGVPDKH